MAKQAEPSGFARPLRKSARIAHQQQARAASSQLPAKQKPNHALPSPSASDPEPIVAVEPSHSSPVGVGAGRKRKRDTDDADPVKRAKKQTSVAGLSEEKIKEDPISYWAAHHVWPEDYKQPMSAKRTKRSNEPDAATSSGRRQSWSEQRKEGLVPEPYGREYETLMITRAMYMDVSLGRDMIAQKSLQMSTSFQESTLKEITPKLVPQKMLYKVVLTCQNRNESMVNRNITPLIVPPIYSLRLGSDEDFEHVCDEVNQPWYDMCHLFGPRPQPDLAVGMFGSAFTAAEHAKLNTYKSVDNWAQFTSHMYFPFLIAEVKCGRKGLDEADRQCMHSASVAVRAICRLEQEADKYRPEKKLSHLNGQILVFSLSHDEKDVRLYGHYAVFQNDEEGWRYYRYPIRFLSIFGNESDLFASHKFMHNVLTRHRKAHLARLQEAIACLPEPTSASFVISETSLGDIQSEAATGDGHQLFVKPVKPASALAKEREESLGNKIEQLLEEQRSDREQRRRKSEEYHREREEHRRQSEEHRRQSEEHRRQGEEYQREREEHRREIEGFRKQKEAVDQQILQLQQMLSTALSGRSNQN